MFRQKQIRNSVGQNDDINEIQPFNKKNFFAHHKRYGKILKPESASKRPAVDYKDYK